MTKLNVSSAEATASRRNDDSLIGRGETSSENDDDVLVRCGNLDSNKAVGQRAYFMVWSFFIEAVIKAQQSARKLPKPWAQ